MDGQSDPRVDGSSGGGMTIGGVTGAALGALGGWFFELHPPAEPASTIWGDAGLIATLHRALSMSCSSLGLDGGNPGHCVCSVAVDIARAQRIYLYVHGKGSGW